ncbi:uncharacterized protein [Periplaneta americana]|uniref:uncharacterized protein isoform X4 n=1 Tax=Periplaneta americana TaxID=6978 RepID=UPI0037E7E889
MKCFLRVTMDVIKEEPEIDPLAIQSNDEKKPLSEEGNLLALHLAGIKTECVDHSYDPTSETKVEQTALPNNFVTTKCKAEEELCDLDTVKDELKLEVTTEENEILTDSFADIRDSTLASYSKVSAKEEHTTIHNAAKHSYSSARMLRTRAGSWRLRIRLELLHSALD